jgi:hypothetical protein
MMVDIHQPQKHALLILAPPVAAIWGKEGGSRIPPRGLAGPWTPFTHFCIAISLFSKLLRWI